MSRSLASSSRLLALTAVWVVLQAWPAAAQVAVRPVALPLTSAVAGTAGELEGVVLDERGQPLVGAVVSALGSSTLFAVSDKDGRFHFRSLPAGAYLVRAHLKGYQSGRARVMHVGATSKSVSTITLKWPTPKGPTPKGPTPKGPTPGEPAPRPADTSSSPEVLAAGVGAPSTSGTSSEDAESHEHGEVAWRLRHQKRSVLKEATQGGGLSGQPVAQPHAPLSKEAPWAHALWRESLAGIEWAVDGPTRVASALFSDLGIDGQLNFLTTASFDRPQDLLTSHASTSRGVALASLETSGPNGQWRMRGALTQGDLSSWLVAGSYVRTAPSTHQYEAGFSYGMQRYFGRSAATLTSMRHDSRAVATVYAFDTWMPVSRLRVGYGAEYAAPDYLGDDALLSPRVSVALRPFEGDPFTVRTTASRRETAPGAEEFRPPSEGVWLPPERTFSAVSSTGTLRPERTDQFEIAAERTMPGGVLVGARAFRQRGEDQVVALFGDGPAGVPATAGHYYVGSVGDFEAIGWGIHAAGSAGDLVRASVDYTRAGATWATRDADRASVVSLAGAVLRAVDRVHDVTATVESRWAPTSTRVLVIYKVNTARAAAEADAEPTLVGNRFDVQLNQGLPFLGFTNARWEALVAVRNMFYGDVLNGSLYDEALVVRPPTRVLGGVTVKF